ncbi:MAG TPA: hypothetical protein VMN35_03700 [Gaiellaceae bacterium]|nr:hypothetical protein [Gaiellaceae bacterium]
MTTRKKLMFAAVAGTAVLAVAGVGAAGAVAASQMFAPSAESKAIIDDAAAQLGVEPSALSDALQQALENRIDDAVDAGRLTEEQAKRLEERLESSDYPQLFGLGGPRGGGFGRGHHGPFASSGLLEAAAAYLGMTEAELRVELRDKTLAEIAEEQGTTASGLVDRLVATQTKRIDEAVDDGKLTEEQAAELEDGLADRVEAFVDGELRGRPGDERHRFWPGSGSPRAPPALRGPPA